MADQPVELHVKGLLKSLTALGDAADAVDALHQKLAASPSSVPASAPQNGAGPTKH